MKPSRLHPRRPTARHRNDRERSGEHRRGKRKDRKVLTGPGYEAHIQTVRGFGYRFAVPGQAGGD